MTSRNKQTKFHIVYSPANKDDLLDNRKMLIEYLNVKCNKWLISDEIGNNDNKHYAIS